jgi:RNA recognition motif-containing protein
MDLRQLFEQHCKATVVNAFVATAGGRSKGYGFVDYASPTDALTAVEKMDKFAIKTKFLSVSIKV